MLIDTFRTGTAAAALLLVGLPSAAHAATVLDVTNYNAFVIGNFEGTNSDVEGRLVVGGDTKLTSYSVGTKLTSGGKGTDTLIVGGNLKATDGQLDHGNLVVGGANNSERFTVRDGTTTTGVNFDFAATGNHLLETSASLSQFANTAQTVNNYGSLNFTGNDANLNVFSITGSQLTNSHGISISVDPKSQVLINVSGNYADWKSMGINLNGLSAENVLFNFYEATNLDIKWISVNGSVLAPKANVKFDDGQMNGILVAANFKGSGELHNTGYKGGLLTPPQTPITPGVPEPATWAMMLLGFAVVGAAMRKRRATPNVSYS